MRTTKDGKSRMRLSKGLDYVTESSVQHGEVTPEDSSRKYLRTLSLKYKSKTMSQCLTFE